jgi:glycosyltransferase involved in cell wall biosynthesis
VGILQGEMGVLTDRNRKRIARIERVNHRSGNREAGVVVVTHDAVGEAEFRQTLTGLDRQTVTNFETVVVDNSPARDLEPVLDDSENVHWYVSMAENVGVNIARNVGANVIDGDHLVFLDHDAVPADDFVEHHNRAHRDRDIVAARGKVRPKTQSRYNSLATNYDLGDRPFPYLLDIEGNCSIRRSTYEAVDGFDEGVWGHEGLRLTAKILAQEESDRVIYDPEPVIYHDFATSLRSLVEKKARHQRAQQHLETTHPELFNLHEEYTIPAGASDRGFLSRTGIYAVQKLTDAVGRRMHERLFSDRLSTE